MATPLIKRPRTGPTVAYGHRLGHVTGDNDALARSILADLIPKTATKIAAVQLNVHSVRHCVLHE
jgi:hypothetical protein